MHRLALLLTLSLACVVAKASSDVLSFEFKNSAGQAFHSQTIGAELSTQASTELSPSILLIYTPGENDPSFQRQRNLLNQSHAAEQLQLLYVVASPSFEEKGGYHVSLSMAGALSPKSKGFLATLLNGSGVVLKRWAKPVSIAEVSRALGEATSHSSLQGRRP